VQAWKQWREEKEREQHRAHRSEQVQRAIANRKARHEARMSTMSSEKRAIRREPI